MRRHPEGQRGMSRRVVARLLIGAAACGMMLSGCGFGATAGDLLPWRVGAVYPLSGPQGDDGAKELAGVQLAAQLVNQDGGVDGRRIAVSSADAPASTDAAAAVDSVLGRGAQMIIGSYGSTISIPASARASAAGALYLETGAVADTVTDRRRMRRT